MRLPGLVVSPQWLSERTDNPEVRIVDVRWSPTGGTEEAAAAFARGHIPGAAFVDVDRDLAGRPFLDGPGRHPIPRHEAFATTMSALGIDDEMYVVVYDDVRGSVAARLWWMLWITGHQVAILDGGLEAWTNEGGRVEIGPPRHREKRIFADAPFPSDRIVAASAVTSTIRTGAAVVLDARAGERYRGEEEPIDPVAGHIPGARSAPWTENLDEEGRFLPPDELRARYQALGVHGDATIVYCGSGVTSCHDLFAMRLAGLGDARVYQGSWSDWITDPDRPRASGAEPGQ